jgi:hypothetical protein
MPIHHHPLPLPPLDDIKEHSQAPWCLVFIAP